MKKNLPNQNFRTARAQTISSGHFEAGFGFFLGCKFFNRQ